MSNPFRSTYRELTQDEADAIARIKTAAANMLVAMDTAYRVPERDLGNLTVRPATREHAEARTRLEESVMWAVKGLTG